MNRKTPKIMTKNRMYHPQSDTVRLFISIKEGGRGLLRITDCIETEEQNLSLYVDQSEEILFRISKSEEILLDYEGPVSQLRNRKKKKDKSNGRRNSFMVNL